MTRTQVMAGRGHRGWSRPSRPRGASAIAAVASLVSGVLVAVGASLVNADGVQAALPGYWSYAAPTLTDTAYPIPSGALFVAPNGNDANPGSKGAPLRTVTKAVSRATSGATIVLRAGIYREAVGSITKRLTIQPYPHERAWLRGSVVVGGFVASGGAWVRQSWRPTAVCRTCFPASAIDPAYPAAGLADQVFVDGVPQRQVLGRGALAAGTFWVDVARSELWLGTDPAGRLVEATSRDKAMQLNTAAASGSVVRGLGFAQYGAHFNLDVPAMVVSTASNVSFVANTFAFSASRGLSVLAPGARVTDNSFVDNGANGFHANAADGLVFQGNTLAYNNLERFSIEPSASASVAAAKVTASDGIVVGGNVVKDNWSNGLWVDISCSQVVLVDNTVLRNAGHGISVELSSGAIVAGNISAANGRTGLKLSGANDVEAWSNTLAGNGWAQLGVYEDARTNPNPTNGATWDTAGVRVVDNVLASPSGSTRPLFDSFDANSPALATTMGMVSADRRNLWIRTAATSPQWVASWQVTPAAKAAFTSLGALQAATQREQSSIPVDGIGLGSVFVAPDRDDYRLAATSPGRVAGTSLPAAVAAAMGVPTTVTMLGALHAPLG